MAGLGILVAAIRDISRSCLDPKDFTVLNCIVKGHASLSSPSLWLRLRSRFTLLAIYTYFDPKDFSPHPSTVSKEKSLNSVSHSSSASPVNYKWVRDQRSIVLPKQDRLKDKLKALGTVAVCQRNSAPHHVALQYINFCTIQSTAKLPTGLPKMMPTWPDRQHFAVFPLNRHHNDGNRFNSCQVIYSQFGLAIHQNDHQARRRFVEWAQNEIAVVPDFHKRILFSDEAHFWLNGYVNKQNCRIWSEANPQVYVETPLHPEKLTVWCALWAGGILLQKR
ncbi:hypothetical protein TNCV_4413001 [Trichonephila clavipes]|nr:hypothetical protein TNCV_4413001 [Trichonephila clavipes]